MWDPVGTYVLACSLRNLAQVRVGGRLVASGSRLTDPSAGEVSGQLHERHEAGDFETRTQDKLAAQG